MLNVHFDLSYLNSYLSFLLIPAPADLYCNNGQCVCVCVMQMLVERRCNVFAFALPLFSFSSFLIRFTWISRLLPLAPTSNQFNWFYFTLVLVYLPSYSFIPQNICEIPSGYFETGLFIECTRVIFRLRCASVKCRTDRWGFLRKEAECFDEFIDCFLFSAVSLHYSRSSFPSLAMLSIVTSSSRHSLVPR